MDTQVISVDDPGAIQRALEVLQRGGLVAFPTDTVYGIGADVFQAIGIERLYEAKGRSTTKAIAVLIGALEQLQALTPGLTPAARRLAEAFWPGALTLVVPRHPGLPENISPLPTIGVREPDHDFARRLIRAAGPLATSSANISGEANAITAEQVLAQLGGRVDLILDGGTTPGGVPSTVVDCTVDPPEILRKGALSDEAIRAVLESG